ncbi:MAG: DUF4476 domain-containing protein [Ferruginibacter sp.]|nr:DUF4476 domain-containing protein [Ferruginibacter sp.]
MIKIKPLLVSIILFLIAFHLSAQQNHFVYIQADNKQPFYVKLNDKVYSSSASGYIILSKLIENNYNLTIGFPKNEWPEQKLNLTIQKNDLGYMLKNFDDKGWGLVDMSSYQIIYNNSYSAQAQATANNEVTTPTQVKEVKKEEVKPIEKIEAEEKRSTITKLFTSKSNSSIDIIYTVKNTNTTDTVKVTIPIDDKKDVNNNVANPQVTTNSTPQVIQEIEKPKPSKPVEVEEKVVSSPPVIKQTSPAIKSNCKSTANEDDYKKLRKKMAAAESDNEMLYRASATFQKQCYTTEQIKTLSFLFLNDEGKYKFLDTAYPYISDSENFPKLVTLLSEEYYVKRFNAMLKK